jgi:hypothetical protein
MTKPSFHTVFKRLVKNQKEAETPPARGMNKPASKAKVLTVAEQERHRVRDIMALPNATINPALTEFLIDSDITFKNAKEVLSWQSKH